MDKMAKGKRRTSKQNHYSETSTCVHKQQTGSKRDKKTHQILKCQTDIYVHQNQDEKLITCKI